MEEIQVGDYVRTKKGFIAKVSEIESSYVFSDDTIDMAYEECRGYVDKKEIVKHSKNIIDLIEVGDYVNAHLVAEVFNDKYLRKGCKKIIINKYLDTSKEHRYYERFIYEKDIKSIVTKEQFENIKYKLEE